MSPGPPEENTIESDLSSIEEYPWEDNEDFVFKIEELDNSA